MHTSLHLILNSILDEDVVCNQLHLYMCHTMDEDVRQVVQLHLWIIPYLTKCVQWGHTFIQPYLTQCVQSYIDIHLYLTVNVCKTYIACPNHFVLTQCVQSYIYTTITWTANDVQSYIYTTILVRNVGTSYIY